MTNLVLYGFNHSTYVRTVRMLLAEKEADYEQVPLNVLKGEPHSPEHLERHPFGKVPVVEHDGLRILETGAIVRYLDAALPGSSFIPEDIKDRARMDMTINLVDAYGYANIIGTVAAYHLFPDLFGPVSDEDYQKGIENSKRVLTEIMAIRGDSDFIAGDERSLADFFLAPICYQVSPTPDAKKVFDVPGFDEWWQRIQALPSYQSTDPNRVEAELDS
ncbi:glutathione S-transferase family protein [Halomonas sp. PR-M31]|uniref:glutathione S-transferase family protein n=1 Tax=Halomonas sp. PR-M31 TaxID=1471202 RepID=UPI000651B8E9|nr:glutathione S-transferase family protein [Halomonas sp. PR-M31]